MFAVSPRTPLPTFAVLFLFRLRFVNVQRRDARIGDQGAGSRAFRFGRERMTAVADADRFFF